MSSSVQEREHTYHNLFLYNKDRVLYSFVGNLSFTTPGTVVAGRELEVSVLSLLSDMHVERLPVLGQGLGICTSVVCTLGSRSLETRRGFFEKNCLTVVAKGTGTRTSSWVPRDILYRSSYWGDFLITNKNMLGTL
jgi:hypothetical protein